MLNHSLRAGLLMLAVLSASHAAHAADSRPGNGLAEIPDPELNLMRGRYTVGGNNVAWFGVSMVSQWHAANGSVAEGALTLGMDFRGGGNAPRVSFIPSVRVTAADAALPGATTARIDSAGLANASGLVQSVQIAGDHNAARNTTSLLVRDGDVPAGTTAAAPTSLLAQAADGTRAGVSFDGQQARLQLQIDGVGQVQQWIRSGSVGQMIALAGDGQRAENRLQIELVRQGLAVNSPLSQNVAQAIALGRGIGSGP